MNRRLKARIVEKFGSQWEFARAAKEHEATVSRIIRGRRELDENGREKWSKLLDIDSNALFGGSTNG